MILQQAALQGQPRKAYAYGSPLRRCCQPAALPWRLRFRQHPPVTQAFVGGISGADDHAALPPSVAPKADKQTWMKLTRIHNMVPSVILVLLGAWAGSGHSFSALQSYTVWAMSLISAGVAVASVVINDYFDFRIDLVNAPEKPLPSGKVPLDVAILLSSCIYMAVLTAACLMEQSAVRMIVAYSAAATLLYTPLFKRLTAIKNATVASVIALAPIAGALAAGAGEAGLQRLLPSTLLAFVGVIYREILMDLNDADGDRQAGVWTLPVMLGKPGALAAALAVALAGCATAVWRLFLQGSAAGQGLLQGAMRVAGVAGADAAAPWMLLAPLAVLGWCMFKLCALARSIHRSGYAEAAVGHAVDACLKPVGLGIILLAALA